MTLRSLIWALSIILLAGCHTQPRNDYGYITLRPSGTDTRDTLSYSLDMSDSTAVYEIYLCSRLSSGFKYDPLEIKVLATSPSGNIYTENISLPTDFEALKKSGEKIKRGSGTFDVEWKYRTNITPVEYGMWRIDLMFLSAGAREKHTIKGIYSFGAYCKKENEQQK